MAEYLNHVVVLDEYDDSTTVGPDVTCDHITITVDSEDADLGAGGQAILFQLAQGKQGSVRWLDEREFYSEPQSFRVGNVIGFRCRNAKPGQKAIIDATLCGPDDPDFGSGTPRQFSVASSSVNYLGKFTAAQWPPQNPSDGDVALISDMIGAFAIQAEMAYSASTGTWTPTDATTLPYAWLDNAITTSTNDYYHNGSNRGWFYMCTANSKYGNAPDLTFDAGIAGIWEFKAKSASYYVGSTLGAGVTTSATATAPSSGDYNSITEPDGRNSVVSPAVQFTLAKGDSAYGYAYNPGTGDMTYGALGVRPIELAG